MHTRRRILRWLRAAAGAAVIVVAAWIVFNPFGVHDLPWGWGRAEWPEASGCSFAVIHVHAADASLTGSWPVRDARPITALPDVVDGPTQTASLGTASIRTEDDHVVFTGPAGDYVWDTSATDAPCAGLFHVDAGQLTTFDAQVVALKPSPAATPTPTPSPSPSPSPSPHR